MYKDLIISLIKQNFQSKEHQKQIRQILDNEKSVFLYSRKLFSFIRNELNEEYEDEYQSLFKKISDCGNNVTITQDSQNFDDEILQIFSTVNDNVVVSISCNQPIRKVMAAIPNMAILSQQQKPNYHWLVINLAILHPFTLSVDELDFQEDKDTDKFFDDLFSIPKKISKVTIFDDYYNVNCHNKYAKIAKKSNIHVSYCTENHKNKFDGKGNYNKDKITILKKSFPKLELYTKNRGSHTRRIIYEGFIVNPDIDLDCLNKADNKMWSVHIRFSEKRSQEIIDIKNSQYTRYSSN